MVCGQITGGPLSELKKVGEKGAKNLWKEINSISAEEIV